jgi:hypothetical protein
LSILLDNSKVITANFIKQYTLAVSADPNQGTVSPNGGIYDTGKAVKLTATPQFPCAFKVWVGADNNTINPTTVTMNADKSVSASFIPLPKKMSDTKGGHTQGIGTVSIVVNQYEWFEGTITCGAPPFPCHAYIQGPDGKNITDFGTGYNATFRIMAPVSGTYNVIIVANGMNTWGTDYSVSYTIYGMP